MTQTAADEDKVTQEIEELTCVIYQRYGFDFRDYAPTSLRRRVLSRLAPERVNSVSDLARKVLDDPDCIERLLRALTIHVTSMFRDPAFYLALREKVMPFLGTYPYLRVWLAGCSSGEEAYSVAILLEEKGLLDRCRLYATDLSEVVVRTARAGIVPLAAMKENTVNYLKSGGTNEFSTYYTAENDLAIFRPSLRNNILFSTHNLVTDGVFNSFHLILCRNVMIYFNQLLQDRVHRLIYESLGLFGVLGLGRGESLKFTPHEDCYEVVDGHEHVYKRIR